MHSNNITSNIDNAIDNANTIDAPYGPLRNDPIHHTAAIGTSRSAAMNPVASSDAIITFAKMLLIMATDVPLGSIDKRKGKENGGTGNYYKKSLINFSIDLMCFNPSEYQVAAKHLLDLGRVMEAIFVCTNGLQQQQQRSSSPIRSNTNDFEPYPLNHFHHSPCQGTEAIDFFNTAIDCASKMTDVGDRSRLFYYLYAFLREYDSESITVHDRIILDGRLNSKFAFRRKSNSSLHSTNTSVGETTPIDNDSDELNKTNNAPAEVIDVNNEDAGNISQKTMDLEKSSMSAQSNFKIDESYNHKEDDNPIKNCSPLAMSVASFPDHLLDGEGNSISNAIRSMFGFPSA